MSFIGSYVAITLDLYHLIVIKSHINSGTENITVSADFAKIHGSATLYNVMSTTVFFIM